tara:strand:+ start:407 stop:2152 length:1746 start_codon:yes stop_codon:yes gene_type:complete
MAFNKIDLDNIKSKILISEELAKKTKVIKKGKDFWCCCPFHKEKTPSCKINDERGSYYCFGCGAKGDIFTIYQELFNYTFLDAVKELANRAGIKINFEQTSNYKEYDKHLQILEISATWFEKNLNVENNLCIKYLHNRKLSNETIKAFRLGYSYNKDLSLYQYLKNLSFTDEEILKSNVAKLDKNANIKDFFYKRLIFPITNITGKVVGFGGRVLNDSHPKYVNSPESKFFKKRSMLYNLNLAKETARQKGNLLICEGYMDVITLFQNNIKSVVAPLGTAFTEEQLKLSWRYANTPTIMFDGDKAGKRASYKAALMSLPFLIPDKSLQFVNLPDNLDPDSFLENNKLNNFINILKKPISLVEYIFNTSSSQISLKNVDQKISYDKFIEDLLKTINDKKIRYFYSREFKSLFFAELRGSRKEVTLSKIPKQITSLKRKQIYSFIASAINHKKIRFQVIDILLTKIELEKFEQDIVNKINNVDFSLIEPDNLISNLSEKLRQFILNNITLSSIYELFPYSSPKFDQDKALIEIKESINNLNTRLSNLKKINKSLIRFENNSSSLNWEELQKISNDLEDEYTDN